MNDPTSGAVDIDAVEQSIRAARKGDHLMRCCQAILNVRALHHSDVGFCVEDGFSWPCFTERSIRQALGESDVPDA